MSAASHRISIVFAAAAALALVAVVPAAAPARAGTILANFESYAEGSLGTAGFTDAASGIRFSEATAFGHNYVIEATTVARPALPSITPGHYLESNGYSPGDGISVSPITGFTRCGNLGQLQSREADFESRLAPTADVSSLDAR